MFPPTLSFHDPTPCGLLHQLADCFAPPPSSSFGGLVWNAWLRLVFDTRRPFRADSEVALDFPLGLAVLRLAVNLARFTKTRVCLSCFGSTNSGRAASHQDPDMFKLLRLCKSWAPCKFFNSRTAFKLCVVLFPSHPLVSFVLCFSSAVQADPRTFLWTPLIRCASPMSSAGK